MILNNIELDIKIKCLEEGTTQQKLAKTIGTTGQYVNRIVKKKEGIVNDKFIQIMDALGYDIELVYIKQEKTKDDQMFNLDMLLEDSSKK